MDKNEIASVAYRYVGSGGPGGGVGVTRIGYQEVGLALRVCPGLERRPCPILSTVVHTKMDLVVSEPCCPCSYRRWKLGDDIDLIVRCEHDGVMTGANGEVSFINIKTLNEWDSRVRRHAAVFLQCVNGVGWSKLSHTTMVGAGIAQVSVSADRVQQSKLRLLLLSLVL